MRGEMNPNRYEISFQLIISLWRSVSSLLAFVWIEEKWNSNRFGFHIGLFDRKEISNQHEIFMWTKFTRSKMNERRPTHWVLRLLRMCVWNSLWVWISYQSFWEKWNFILGDKISCKHNSKWNAYACPLKY